MIDMTFGKLKIIERAGTAKDGQKVYLCECECGNKSKVLAGNLKRGNTKSCGCMVKKTSSLRMKNLNKTHGQTKTKLWKTWKGIVERTTKAYSSHFFRYGAKGIGIYGDWLKFEAFAEYIGDPPSPSHTIDRIDNSKGYFPGNIRWATMKDQASNRSTNVHVMIDGEVMILSDAAKKLGISRATASRWKRIGKLRLSNE